VFLSLSGGSGAIRSLRNEPCDLRFQLWRLVPAAVFHLDLAVLIYEEVRRKTDIDISLAVAVCVLQDDAETIRQNVEVERIAFQVGVNLRLVVGRQCQEYHAFVTVLVGKLVELRYLAVADGAAC